MDTLGYMLSFSMHKKLAEPCKTRERVLVEKSLKITIGHCFIMHMKGYTVFCMYMKHYIAFDGW